MTATRLVGPARFVDLWRRATSPSATGLPRWHILLAFPALLTVVAAVLSALRISGTSSGSYWRFFGEGTDPRLLAGTPRYLRSDEWLVNQGWVVSQSETGYQPVNPTFPGGMDATVLQDLPSTDWSIAFRPQDWGFVFGLEFGVAWQWWFPALLLIAGSYALMVTLVPRRPVTAATVSLAVFLSPVFQWIWGGSVALPVAWAFLTMAAIRWITRDERRWVAAVWAAIAGFTGVTAALTVYVPFIIPCVAVVIAFAAGSVLGWRRDTELSFRVLAVRAIPLIVAGAGALGVLAIWAITKSATLLTINSTVYPGARVVPSGDLLARDPQLLGTLGAMFSQSFSVATGETVLGSNPSAAASVPLFAVFVVPGLIALVVRHYRRERQLDWIAICSLVLLALVGLFLVVPGLDLLGSVLFFDKVTGPRFRIIFAVLLPLFFALIVRHVDREPNRWASWGGVISAVLAATSAAWVLRAIVLYSPELLPAGPLWPLATACFIGGVYFVFVRRAVWLSGVLLLVMGIIVGAGVNPLYVGVFNLNDTKAGQSIDAIHEDDPGRWIGIGGAEIMGLLMQSGKPGYSGLQTYPPAEMWEGIDPSGQYEENWNRLAHVRWGWGEGEPKVQLFQRDVIVTSFDPCSAFAQDNVKHVVSTELPPSSDCLEEVAHVTEGVSEIWIYDVTPPTETSADTTDSAGRG